jgi:hypothetical protein
MTEPAQPDLTSMTTSAIRHCDVYIVSGDLPIRTVTSDARPGAGTLRC